MNQLTKFLVLVAALAWSGAAPLLASEAAAEVAHATGSAPDITLNLLTIAFLIFATGFFVAAEYALVRIRWTRIETLIAEGNAGARIVKQATERLTTFLSATQVGITLSSLALGWRGEPFVAEYLFLPLLQALLPAKVAAVSAHGIAVAVALLLITYLHVVLGELVPRSLALYNPERIALYIARPMTVFVYTFRPVIWALNSTSAAILKLFGIKIADIHGLALSEEELLLLLSESKKAGVVSEEEQRMLQRVFKFHDKTVREIMKPRPDIAALDVRATEHEMKSAFEQGYSRLPVFDGNLNNIKGIIYVKDLIYTLQDPKLIKLVDLLREAVFVPETKAVSELLREFQRNKMHMAIVVDEFGDTAGVVTLEDVIEEIVGEIQDEYDVEPVEIERTSDGTFIFDGKATIDRFKEIFPKHELPEGPFDTVAGLVFQLAGRVPRESDVLRLENLTFRVIKREGRRLKKIAVRREAVAEPRAAGDEKPPAPPGDAADKAAAEEHSPTRRYEAILDETRAEGTSAEDDDVTEPPPDAPPAGDRPISRRRGSSAGIR